jgi:hypothetical protein
MPLKLTPRLAKQVDKMVRTTCANYYDGHCLLLDDGDSHPCVQLLSVSRLCCNYLEKYVLPSESKLYTAIIKYNQS